MYQFEHYAGPVAADYQLFVGVFHDAVMTDREAFGLERQNVGDHAIGVDSKRQAIVACSTWTLLFFCIWFMHLARQNALIDQVQMLKFLVVKAEKQRGNHPIGMSNRSKVLHREKDRKSTRLNSSH